MVGEKVVLHTAHQDYLAHKVTSCLLFTPLKVVELKVGVHCERCLKAIKKAIKKIEDIETYRVDTELNKVTVTGNVTTEEVIRVLNKIGKNATYWNYNE